MNNSEFCKNFIFCLHQPADGHHTDNSHGLEYHALLRLRSGSGLIVTRQMRMEVHKDDLVYLPKGLQYHSYWYAGPPDNTVYFDSYGFYSFPSAASVTYGLQKVNCSAQEWSLFEQLARSKNTDCTTVGQLYTLFGMLQSHMQADPVGPKNSLAVHALKILQLSPTIRTDELAQVCNVSESTLYQLFRNAFQKTPNQMRQEIRCEQAIELLTSTDLSVEAISERLGFSSSSYFRKILFAVTGKTPRQIRKESRIRL